MKNIGAALIVGSEDYRQLHLADELREAGYFIKSVSGCATALRYLNRIKFDVLVVWAASMGESEIEMVRRVNRVQPDVMVIILLDCGEDGEEEAEELENVDILDRLTVPFATVDILEAMNRGMLLKLTRERTRGNSISAVASAAS